MNFPIISPSNPHTTALKSEFWPLSHCTASTGGDSVASACLGIGGADLRKNGGWSRNKDGFKLPLQKYTPSKRKGDLKIIHGDILSVKKRIRKISHWSSLLYIYIITYYNPHKAHITHIIYPLVSVFITMENHHVQWVNPLFLWSFSTATLNYQRVTEEFTKNLVTKCNQPKLATRNSAIRWHPDVS